MKLNPKMALVLCAALRYSAQTFAEGGSTKWVHASTYGFGGNDSDRAGNIVVAGGNYGQTLFKFNSDGQLLWSIKEPNPDFGYDYVAVAKDSGTFYAVGGDFRMFRGAIVVRFAADGADRTLIEDTCDTCPRNTAAVDDGGKIWAVTNWFARSVAYHRAADGSGWSLSGGLLDLYDVAFDPEGNVIIGAAVNGRTIWEGQAIGADGVYTPLVLKYDSERRFLWLVQLLGLDGNVISVRTSVAGTIVAAGDFNGETTFGSDVLSHPPNGDNRARMLLTIESDGTPRWARQLAEGWRWATPHIKLAVDPPGKVAIAFTLPDCSSSRVEYWNLAGEPLWNRTFVPRDCQGSVALYGLSISNGDVVLSGWLRGTVDFGTGEITGPKGFLVQLSQ